MELLAFLFIWPFLILVVGLVFLSINILNISALWLPAIIFLIVLYVMRNKVGESLSISGRARTELEQLEDIRRVVIIFSISILLPIFTRFFIAAWQNALPGIIFGLSIGFVCLLWGMFVKNNHVLMYSNLVGGILTLIYAYFRIWELGDFARVIAAAFGLAVAVTVSIIKLKERLK